ncbi:nitrate assimilation regulatory protein nirA [Lasiosphaeria ovina]|uniref:Nitrate assimilation regulatory protein nirA n=1 Tax=Lasiosphaeria ovina TaxID=92902 RepID=A0AAE0N0Z8_9PEZI|nr:nitrate assimilation regulatory protein nirA [Lasiosphaeria ovina]
MTSRAQTRTACQRCRKKRSKCDGKTPCRRCGEAQQTCEYNHTRRESKDELRAEKDRLSKRSHDTDNVLLTLASIQDAQVCKRVLQALIDGSMSRADVLRRFGQESQESDTSPTPSAPGSGSGPAYSPASSLPQPPSWQYYSGSVNSPDSEGVYLASCPRAGCFDHLTSWRSSPFTDAGSPSNPTSAISAPSTVLSLPPLPLDAYASHSRLDTWTRTGWTAAHIRHLIDVLLTSDYLPFCLLCTDLFLHDFERGSSRFCSAALVHAILALSTCLVNENNDSSGLLPSGWVGSQTFVEEAQSDFCQGGQPDALPDIQALGILALYRLRCGREAEAQELAEVCVTSITDLCQRMPLDGEEEELHARVRATTYCGAITLVRILSLVTGRTFNVLNHKDQDDLVYLDQVSRSSGGKSEWRGAMRPKTHTDLAKEAHSAELLQLMAAKIFQLTELVYKISTAARKDVEAASAEIVSTYTSCLNWYNDFFTLFDSESGRTPFVLFVHMFYHFCLLCAIQPFVGLKIDSDMRPHEICMQATQSILALVQSYDDLFTLRRVSGLIPYFVCISGLFSLAMQDSGSHVDPSYLRPGGGGTPLVARQVPDDTEGNPAEPKQDGSSAPPAPPLRIKTSAAAHASLLLAKISSTHPAAAAADRLLRRELAPAREGDRLPG